MPPTPSFRDWMDTWTNKKPPSLSLTRSTEILDRIEYRLSESPREKEELYKLRYRAYLRQGAIPPNSSQSYSDRYDDASNSWLFGVYSDGELYSSIRISVISKSHPESMATEFFGDILDSEIASGKTIIDPSCFVADPEKAMRLPELPYVTIRLAFLACAHFEADLHLATVSPEHQAFYRRVFLQQMTAAEPRLLPGQMKRVALMAADYQATREAIFARYPYLRSSNFERRMLFEKGSLKFATAKRSLAEIKSNLRKIWGDDSVLSLCMKILDRATIGPINETEILDFSALCRMTGKNRPDAELLKAVTILTTSNLPSLRVCARAKMDDGNYYELRPDDLSHAIDIALGESSEDRARQANKELTGRILIYFMPASTFEDPPAELLASSP